MSDSPDVTDVPAAAWVPQAGTLLAAGAVDSVAGDCLVADSILSGAYELISARSYTLIIPAQTGAHVGLGIGGIALARNTSGTTTVPFEQPTLFVDDQEVPGAWTRSPSGSCASWSYQTSWLDSSRPVAVHFSVPEPLVQVSFLVQRATATSSSPTTRPLAKQRPGLTTGVIAGSVVAAVLVAIAGTLAFILIRRRRRRRRAADLDPEPTVTAYYAHEHDTTPDPMPNRKGIVILSAPAQANSSDNANDAIREAKLARLLPPASDKASSSNVTQTPPPRADTDVDAAIPELYAAMRDAGFTVHTLFDHLRQRPQDVDEAAQNEEPHSETLPLYENPRRKQ